mgnify:CR=1 FL=1
MLAWLLIPAGIAITVFSEKVGNFTGEMSFAETAFGPGGTYVFIKIFGVMTSFVAFAWLIGGLEILLSPLQFLFP